LYHPKHVVYGHTLTQLKGIDLTSSPGFPYTTISGMNTRKSLFGSRPETQIWDNVPPAFVQEIDLIFKNIKDPHSTYLPIFTLSLKCERKQIEKTLAGNTRKFEAGPVDAQIVSGCYNADWSRIAHSIPHGTLTYTIDPDSPDWGMLVNRMLKHPNHICLDTEKFDLHVHPQLYEHVGCEERRYLRAYEFKDLSGLDLAATHLVAHPKVHMMNMLNASLMHQNLYLKVCGISSGADSTTDKNTKYSLAVEQYTFIDLAIENKVRPEGISHAEYFRRNVEFAGVGDDLWISCSDEVAPWYNQITTSKYKKEHLDVTMTDTNKEDISRPFTPFEEVSLIKRRPVKRDGIWHAEFPSEGVHEMICWVKDPSNANVLTSQTVASATRLAATRGRQFYDDFVATVGPACLSHSIKFLPYPYEDYMNAVRGYKL